MPLAASYLERHHTPLAAYNALQLAMMRRYVALGGTPLRWCERVAARFHERYGWMLERAANAS